MSLAYITSVSDIEVFVNLSICKAFHARRYLTLFLACGCSVTWYWYHVRIPVSHLFVGCQKVFMRVRWYVDLCVAEHEIE